MKQQDVTSARTRRVTFDKATQRYVCDTRMEALERAIRDRRKDSDTKNRGEDKVMQYNIRQSENANHIFETQHNRVQDITRQSLLYKLAHRTLLEEIAQKNKASSEYSENLGRYGPRTSMFELQAQIEDTARHLSPYHRRRKEAGLLLSQRRQMEVVDRNLDTPTMMRSWRSAQPEIRPGRTSAQLRLPPLVVQRDIVTSVPDVIKHSLQNISPDNSSIFITQKTQPY